jgi:nucleoside 2-deoxyribosyltransferase
MQVGVAPPVHAGLLRVDDLEDVRKRMYRVYLASPMSNLPKSREKLTDSARAKIWNVLVRSRDCPFDVYDPTHHTPPSSSHSPNCVYALDHLEVASSDALVVCATSPADGIGREAEFALANRIPTLLVYRDDTRVSKLMRAQPLALPLEPVVFHRLAEVEGLLEQRLPNFGRLVVEQAAQRRALRETGSLQRLREMIIGMRLLAGMTRAALAAKVSFDLEWVCQLERHDEIIAGLSQLNLLALFQALNSRFAIRADGRIEGGFADTEAGQAVDRRLRQAWHQSLQELVEYVAVSAPAKDECILWMWGEYHEMMTQALAAREDLSVPVRFEQWHGRYRSSLDGLMF